MTRAIRYIWESAIQVQTHGVKVVRDVSHAESLSDLFRVFF